MVKIGCVDADTGAGAGAGAFSGRGALSIAALLHVVVTIDAGAL